MYIFIEFNSRITAQNRTRNSNSKLTICHLNHFFVHESDSEYASQWMSTKQSIKQSISQSVNRSTINQSINQTQSANSVSLYINQSISSVHIVVCLIFSSYSRRILHNLVFSLDIYTIIINPIKCLISTPHPTHFL